MDDDFEDDDLDSLDSLDAFDGDGREDELEEELEAARDEGRQEVAGNDGCGAFGCGCLVGMALLFVAIGMGWCTAPHFR